MPDTLKSNINKIYVEDSSTYIAFKPSNMFFDIFDPDYLQTEMNVIPEEIFGKESIVYEKVSDISNIKTIENSVSLYIKNGISLGLIIFFLLLFLFFRNSISSIYKIITDYRFSKKQYEENTTIDVNSPLLLILFTVLIISISFFLPTGTSNFKLILIYFLSLTGILILQSALLELSGWISKSETLFGEINFNRKYFIGIIGLFIFPFTLAELLYEDMLIKTVYVVSGIFLLFLLLLMIIRILKVFSEARVSYFFRFLYLCTFELSPYLVLLIVFKHFIK